MAGGRPSSYTEALADEICERLTAGESLVRICMSPHMPRRETVVNWQYARPEFAERVRLARIEQAELMDDMILEVANASTPETAHSDKVKISAYQWRAAKLKPKIYGEKTQHTGPDGEGPVVTEITYRWRKPDEE